MFVQANEPSPSCLQLELFVEFFCSFSNFVQKPALENEKSTDEQIAVEIERYEGEEREEREDWESTWTVHLKTLSSWTKFETYNF